MADIVMKDLLEAGVHFGHQTRRWNPQMKKFIFMERNGIYIIDLQKTLKCAQEAKAAIEKVVRGGGHVLFVATKKQAKPIVVEEATRCGQYYVTERWLGGMLTNFKTIRTSIKRLHELDRMATDGTFEKMSKKEVSRLSRERARLEFAFSGIKEMPGLPSLVFVIDTKKEKIAIAEANRLARPDRGRRGHELRPHRGELPDPGQRRRDPGDPPVHAHGRGHHPRDARRRAGGRRPGDGLVRRRGSRGRGSDREHPVTGERVR